MTFHHKHQWTGSPLKHTAKSRRKYWVFALHGSCPNVDAWARMQSISSETWPVVADSTHDTETLRSPGKRVFAAVPAESDHRCAGAGRENSDNALPAAGNRARGLASMIVLLIRDMLPAQNRLKIPVRDGSDAVGEEATESSGCLRGRNGCARCPCWRVLRRPQSQ